MAILYSARDLAEIISSMKLGCREESHIIDLIGEEENSLLDYQYRKDKRKFILEVRRWIDYIYEKPALDREISAVQKDLDSSGHAMNMGQYVSDDTDFDLFLKGVRIRILYGKGNDYVTIKLRSLLAQYGCQRRSRWLIQRINRCMFFYHPKATLRGGADCDIKTCGLDRMVTFRVV